MSLSRRSLVASAAALPALAMPAIALPQPKTRIAKLYAEYLEAKRECQKVALVVQEIEAAVDREMPEPHPLIARTQENLSLLRVVTAWDTSTTRKAIEPFRFPEHERERHELTTHYDDERRRRLGETNYEAINEQLDAIAARQGELTHIIENSRPRTRGDIEIKLAVVAELDEDREHPNPLAKDLKHLLAKPAVLTV
jgi:hypothetical protein